MNPDKPLGSQLVFVYEKARLYQHTERRGPTDTPPECIRCKCRIIQSRWSPEVEYSRRTGMLLRDKPSVETIQNLSINPPGRRGVKPIE